MVYPDLSKDDSSNFNPVPIWALGV